MKKYRIKTEEEFISDFGKDWKYHLYNSWPEEMDFLFGKEILKEFYDILQRSKDAKHESGWWLCKKCVKEVTEDLDASSEPTFPIIDKKVKPIKFVF